MKWKEDFPKRLKVGAIVPPTMMYPAKLIGGNRKMYMMEESLLSLLMEVLGFESEIVEPTDKEYGHIKEDGNWTGLIEMVRKEEIDIIISRLSLTYERNSEVDYLYPLSIIPVTFITDKPSPSSNSTALFEPFSFLVWGTIFISLATAFLVSIVSMTKKDRSCPMLLTYGVLLENSIKLKFKKKSLKLFMLFWIIGAMFITLSYKAVLLSFLTIPVLTGVRDIAELSVASENPSFKCSTFKGSNEYYKLNTATDQSWKKISKCFNRSNMFTNDIQTFLRPTDYKKAFITARVFLVSFERNYFLSKDIFFNNVAGIAVRKTFCCKEILDKFIHRITAVGILNKFIVEDEFFMSLAEKDLNKDESDINRKLSLFELLGAFLILVFGLSLACTVFLLEVLLGNKSSCSLEL